MATAAIQFPSSNTVLPGSRLLPTVRLPDTCRTQSSLPHFKTSPASIAEEWVSAFIELLGGNHASVKKLFFEESCWRDLLCMSWDFRTLQGPEQISRFIQSSSQGPRLTAVSLDSSSAHKSPQSADFGGLKAVQAFLKVETNSGRGEGSSLEDRGRNWKDRLVTQQDFQGGRQPIVLIVGAGQGGLTVAARLKQLGLETLIIERNPRIGDNWRNRYHQLVLHDSVWYDHMPYLNFPPNWPVFTPKDKLADWFEYYTGVLELNVWTKTTLESSAWSESTRQWTVTLMREKDGKKENRSSTLLNHIQVSNENIGILHPRHVILATGHAGEPYLPSDIAGITDFEGTLMHSCRFNKPREKTSGKKAVIVGCCNSGHDIARDFYDHGYDVTMVQRSSTLVLTSKTLIDVTMKGLYAEDGPPVEDADIVNTSVSNPIAKHLQIQVTSEMMQRDGTLLRGLVAAGFAVDSGPDGAGLFMKYLSRGGGYYIDVGASQLIADKKIKIKQGQQVKSIKAHGLVLADDSELEADEIVFATGYQNMRETARKIFGDDLADRVHDVWGFDDEGETRVMWRRSGHPGFWFFGGNLALCRFYSRLLALQIKAIEVGLTRG